MNSVAVKPENLNSPDHVRAKLENLTRALSNLQNTSSFTEGDDLRLNLAAMKRLTKHDSVNVVALRRKIAAAVIEADGYLN